MTLQPVPQKRHAALSHFSSLVARSVTRLAAPATDGMPPAKAAIAAASSLRTWRRSSLDPVIGSSLASGCRVNRVEHEGSGIDVGQQRDVVEGCPQRDRKSTRLNSSHGYISYAV